MKKKLKNQLKYQKLLKKFMILIKKIQEKSVKGLKILTSNQMLSRLPITLAQLKA